MKLLSEAVAETPLTLNVRRHNTEGRLKLMKKGHVSVASKDVAFYYPGPFWYSAAWVKNLLLFFDGIALLVPTYMKNRPSDAGREYVGLIPCGKRVRPNHIFNAMRAGAGCGWR